MMRRLRKAIAKALIRLAKKFDDSSFSRYGCIIVNGEPVYSTKSVTLRIGVIDARDEGSEWVMDDLDEGSE